MEQGDLEEGRLAQDCLMARTVPETARGTALHKAAQPDTEHTAARASALHLPDA